MLIRVLSDLHLEGNRVYYEYAGEDVLVLAGDIDTKNRHEMFLSFIPENVKILMVAGNHEYYGNEFHYVNEYLTGLMDKFPNFTFLNNNSTVIDDVHFFGGTMWSDFYLYGDTESWFGKHDAKRFIRDYSVTNILDNNGLRRWTIEDHTDEYEKFNEEFDCWVKLHEGKKRVCISHFLPSKLSIDPYFKDSALNSYFASNNDDRVQLVDIWIHGHTHASCDYILGDTRVVCNPHGYGRENSNGFNPELIVEI